MVFRAKYACFKTRLDSQTELERLYNERASEIWLAHEMVRLPALEAEEERLGDIAHNMFDELKATLPDSPMCLSQFIRRRNLLFSSLAHFMSSSLLSDIAS